MFESKYLFFSCVSHTTCNSRTKNGTGVWKMANCRTIQENSPNVTEISFWVLEVLCTHACKTKCAIRACLGRDRVSRCAIRACLGGRGSAAGPGAGCTSRSVCSLIPVPHLCGAVAVITAPQTFLRCPIGYLRLNR